MTSVVCMAGAATVERCSKVGFSDDTENKIGDVMFRLALFDVIAAVGLLVAGAIICSGRTSLPAKVAYPMLGVSGSILALFTGLAVRMCKSNNS